MSKDSYKVKQEYLDALPSGGQTLPEALSLIKHYNEAIKINDSEFEALPSGVKQYFEKVS